MERSRLREMQAVRERSPGDRDRFLKWSAGDVPCGAPEWLVLAATSDAAPTATVLAGGPKGVAALSAADGKLRWSVELSGTSLSPAVARGRVYLAAADGTVRCLAAK